MADIIQTPGSNLAVGDDIIWLGKYCRVRSLEPPRQVVVQEYKSWRHVAKREFKSKHYFVPMDKIIDRVITEA